MNQLKINATDSESIKNYINRYELWRDSKNFYEGKNQSYMVINSSDGIPCYHYTDIEAINNDTSNLIAIDCMTEGIHSINFFKNYRSDHHYIIFSNGTWDRETYLLPINYTLIWHLFFLVEMCDTFNSPNRFCYYLDTTYKFDYPKPFIFISTTGNVRPERDRIVNLVKNKISYKDFIFRYSGQDIKQPSNHFDVIKFNKGDFDPYTSVLAKYYHSVSQSVPIKLYNQSYFNLIVESDLSLNDSFFLTEKTIKSLITGQPFVICATPKFLENLRNLGFKTYNSLWNEDYDNILNFDKRMEEVVDLCRTLENFDWAKHRLELEEIQKHNNYRFIRSSSIIEEELCRLEKIIKAL